MNATEKKKLKKVIIITSVLSLAIIAILGMEYLNEKRKDRGIKHFHEIVVTVRLADMLGANLECSDKIETVGSWQLKSKA